MRAVLSLVTREIRSTGCDPSEAGFDFFALADATQLQCRMDLNGDRDIADMGPDEDISYSLVGEDLVRNNGSGDEVIMDGIQILTFTYFDEAGNQMLALPLTAANRALIRYVGINIQGETERGEPVTYSTRIALRNG